MEKETRDRERIDLTKLAFAKDGKTAQGGVLHDISASGLSIQFVNPMGKVENPFHKDETLEILVDEIGSLKGTVIRSTEDSVAVKLNIDTKDEEELIALIMAAASEIDVDAEA